MLRPPAVRRTLQASFRRRWPAGWLRPRPRPAPGCRASAGFLPMPVSHWSAMPAPPMKPILPSTISSSRCVRLSEPAADTTSTPLYRATLPPASSSGRRNESLAVTLPKASSSYVDLDSGARPLGQGFHIPASDVALVEDVGFETHAAARLADGLEHRRIEILAIGEHFEPAGAVHLRIDQRLQYIEELVAVVGGQLIGALDPIVGQRTEDTRQQMRGHQHKRDSTQDHPGGRQRDCQHDQQRFSPSVRFSCRPNTACLVTDTFRTTTRLDAGSIRGDGFTIR